MTHHVKTRRITVSRKSAHCPRCGEISRRHSIGCRCLRDVGISGPTMLEVTYSKHYCEMCRKHFSIPMEHLAVPSGRFTHRVRRAAVEMVVSRALTPEKAAYRMWQKYFVHVPATTLRGWVRELAA